MHFAFYRAESFGEVLCKTSFFYPFSLLYLLSISHADYSEGQQAYDAGKYNETFVAGGGVLHFGRLRYIP